MIFFKVSVCIHKTTEYEEIATHHTKMETYHKDLVKWHAKRATLHTEMAAACKATCHAEMAAWHAEMVIYHVEMVTYLVDNPTSCDTVSYTTMESDHNISWTISVPSDASPKDALKTLMQSTIGFIPYDLSLEMNEPGKYVIKCNRNDMISMKFIKGCSVVVSEGGTTETEKERVQEELLKCIIQEPIPELDLHEVYAHFGITTIGDDAFYECTSLKKVVIPDNVTAIGRRAFYGCTSLTTVDIPGGVATIGDCAFYGCPLLLKPGGNVYERMVHNYTTQYLGSTK
jgi:hypothetical protein